MSIERICKQAELTGLLQRVLPLAHKPARRRLFVTKEAAKDLGAHGAIAVLGLRPQVRARFEEWVTGEQILSEGNRKPGYLKQLDAPPHEIWEFRISTPVKKVRALGRFMKADAYVVTGVYLRDFLGKYGSKEWKDAEQHCLDLWNTIFGNMPPWSGKTYADYVTENCDEFRLGRILSERERELRRRAGKRRCSSRR